MPAITELLCFVATEAGGDEGIPAVMHGNTMMPLIGADRERIDSLREEAQFIADMTGITLTLCRFTVREEIDVVRPRDKALDG